MNETEKGYLWDVSFTPSIVDEEELFIFIDTGEDSQFYLSKNDLKEMLAALED